MQREQGVAVGREWAGGRSTVGADEPQRQVFRVPRTHRWSRRGRLGPGGAARAGGRGGTGWASLA